MSRDLLREGCARWSEDDPVHAFLATAFRHRVGQALGGTAPTGALPPELLLRLAGRELNRLERYQIDTFRFHSRILDPEGFVDPYRAALSTRQGADGVTPSLVTLPDIPDPPLLSRRVRHHLQVSQGSEPLSAGVLFLLLEPALRLDHATASEVCALVPGALKSESNACQRAKLLIRGLRVAARLGRREDVRGLAEEVPRALATCRDAGVVEELVRSATASLASAGMLDVLAVILLKAEEFSPRLGTTEAMRSLAAVAGGWFVAGKPSRGVAALETIRSRLFAVSGLSAVDRTWIASGYLDALGCGWGQLPSGRVLGRAEEVFQRLSSVQLRGTSNARFTSGPLRVVEAAIRCGVGHDADVGEKAKEWAEHQVRVIRRQIDRDLDNQLGDVSM